jgi:hypothetical protein
MWIQLTCVRISKMQELLLECSSTRLRMRPRWTLISGPVSHFDMHPPDDGPAVVRVVPLSLRKAVQEKDFPAKGRIRCWHDCERRSPEASAKGGKRSAGTFHRESRANHWSP